MLSSNIGRFVDKTPDWDAFPANRGFPELERAQYRYIGAGGSPKSDDPTTLKAQHFTLSLIYQPPGKYAAVHHHEIEEAFFILSGVLTVSWDYDGQMVSSRLGPNDMILNPPGRAHGFRNEGVEPVFLSIMVGSATPLAPVYTSHPKDAAAASPGDVHAASGDCLADMERHIARRHAQTPVWHPAGFAMLPYIGPGGVAAGHYRNDVLHLPAGRGVRPYSRPVEDAYFVLQGQLTVGWEDDAGQREARLGPKDVILNPPGQRHYFRNDGLAEAEFEMVTGSPEPETVRFEAS